MCKFTAASFCAGAIHIPLTNTEVSGGEAVLPAVLVILSVENLLLVLLGGDVVLPLLLTVTVLPTHPAVEVHRDFSVVCRHVDLLPVLFATVTSCLVTFLSFFGSSARVHKIALYHVFCYPSCKSTLPVPQDYEQRNSCQHTDTFFY